MKRFLVLACIVAVALCVAPLCAGEQDDPSLLTVARIFDSKQFSPKSFSARWLEDSSGYLTLEPSKDTSGGRDIVRHDPRTDQTEVLVPAAHLIPPGESGALGIDGYSFSKDRSLLLIYTNSKRVWRKNTRGDYWVLDRAGRELWKLGGDARSSTLMFAKFSPTGRYVAYVRDNNIYVQDLHDRGITPLTTSASSTVVNGTFDWVYEEEFRLRDGFQWSPDGKSIAYWQINTEGVRQFTLVNQTDGLYPRLTSFAYPKVGQRNPIGRVGVADLQSKKTRWLDVPGDPRDHYIARMSWAHGPDAVLIEQLNRLQNTNRVMLADPDSGTVQTILTETDEAWVDVHDELKWLSDGKQFTWISQRDGWRHVYVASRSGEELQRVTAGDYDAVRLVHVDEQKGWLYFMASPENPTQRYLYRVRLDGTGLERLTPSDQSGTHSYEISPDAGYAIHTWSSFGSPPVVRVIELPGHETIRTLVANKPLQEKLGKLKLGTSEFFRVEIGDQVELDAWCILPPDFNPKRKYPVLVYVYGEPAGQTVVDRWGGSNYLWHLMLAQRGYIVMSFDNRGTPAPRGRAWRKAVHRRVGILAPQDQAAALRKVLAERNYADADRVGIWGWSGGGSMSLNAIFKYPDLYKTAISVAPVPNQRYYDTIYQERYMGLPNDNVDGFLRGSPINQTHQLEGNLLLIHGTGDNNCHYQGTEALINELVRHKKHFTMMAYPNRSHSIREGKNTTRHLRELMTRYLADNLTPGPRKPGGD